MNRVGNIFKEANKIDVNKINVNNESPQENIIKVPIDKIKPNPLNEQIYNVEKEPIDDLLVSIKEYGQIEALVAYKEKERSKSSDYILVSGHRRLRVFKQLGYTSIEIKLIPKPKGTEEHRLLAAYNNGQRKVDTFVMAARAEFHYKIFEMENLPNKIEKVAEFLGISVTSVKRYLSLSKLIKEFQELIRNETISLSSITTVAAMEEEEQKELYKLFEDYIKSQESITYDNNTDASELKVEITRDTAFRIIDKFKKMQKGEEVPYSQSNQGEIQIKKNITDDKVSNELNKEEAETKKSVQAPAASNNSGGKSSSVKGSKNRTELGDVKKNLNYLIGYARELEKITKGNLSEDYINYLENLNKILREEIEKFQKTFNLT